MGEREGVHIVQIVLRLRMLLEAVCVCVFPHNISLKIKERFPLGY